MRRVITEYVIHSDIYAESSTQFTGVYCSTQHPSLNGYPGQDVIWLCGNRGDYDSIKTNVDYTALYWLVSKSKNKESWTVVPVMQDFLEMQRNEEDLYKTIITDTYSRMPLPSVPTEFRGSEYSEVRATYLPAFRKRGIQINLIQDNIRPIEEIIVADVAVIRSHFHRIKYSFETNDTEQYTAAIEETFAKKLIANYWITNSTLPQSDWNHKMTINPNFKNFLHVHKHIIEINELSKGGSEYSIILPAI